MATRGWRGAKFNTVKENVSKIAKIKKGRYTTGRCLIASNVAFRVFLISFIFV